MDMERRQFLKLAGAGIGAAALAGLGYYSWGGLFNTSSESLRVFAGSVNKPPLDTIIADYEASHPASIDVSYGGSGFVLSQMLNAQKGDLYVPGSHDFMERAIQLGVVDESTIEILAYVVPAICVKRGNPKGIHTLEDLARDDVRVGMGNPETVCVGLYAHEILCRAGLWDEVKIQIENRYVNSCSSTESLLVLDQADAVMGWDVFEHWDPDAVEAITIDPEYLPRAAYIPGAVSTYAADLGKARDFLNFIVSKKAVYGAEGYLTTEQELHILYPNIEIGGLYELPENWDA